jgi:release factor glutamine methyltransferase
MKENKKKKGIFEPTGTSRLLLDSSNKFIKKNKKVLDLGCGSGIIGLDISKNFNMIVYMSDISKQAIKEAKKSSEKTFKANIIKHGSIFEPWESEKFDLIICDVAGVSEKISSITPWYKNKVPNGSGKDGTKNILRVIDEAHNYLNKKGKLLIAVISLSNHKKILNFAKKKFKYFKILNKQDWPLPKEMYKYEKKLLAAKAENLVSFKKKYNFIVYWTEIYVMWN